MFILSYDVNEYLFISIRNYNNETIGLLVSTYLNVQ